MNSNSAAMCAPSHRVCISCQSMAGMGRKSGVAGVRDMGNGVPWQPCPPADAGAGGAPAVCRPERRGLQVLYFEDFVFNHTTRGVYGYDFAFFLANQGASDGRGDGDFALFEVGFVFANNLVVDGFVIFQIA